MSYDLDYFKSILPKRPKDAHKGTFGHVLNIAGSGFYIGAAYFSSVAALKMGCGKLTLASVESVIRAVSSLTPDVIFMPLSDDKTITKTAILKLGPVLANYEAISVGCGLSTNKNTCDFFEKLIKNLAENDNPVLVDADGLNLLSMLNGIELPKNTVLTPHPKELSRLLNVSVEAITAEPEIWVKKCCEKYDCTTVLKLHNTIVADNKNNYYLNNTGNTALSHGGSGDVLTGMISSLLAQGLSCFEASTLGVYLHGLTAEIASEDLTEYSVLASDLLGYIPHAIKKVL